MRNEKNRGGQTMPLEQARQDIGKQEEEEQLLFAQPQEKKKMTKPHQLLTKGDR